MTRIESFDPSPKQPYSYRFKQALDYVRWHVEETFGLRVVDADAREAVTDEHVRAFVLRVGREYLSRRIHRVGPTSALELWTWANLPEGR